MGSCLVVHLDHAIDVIMAKPGWGVLTNFFRVIVASLTIIEKADVSAIGGWCTGSADGHSWSSVIQQFDDVTLHGQRLEMYSISDQPPWVPPLCLYVFP